MADSRPVSIAAPPPSGASGAAHGPAAGGGYQP